jgi:hypothetical protein
MGRARMNVFTVEEAIERSLREETPRCFGRQFVEDNVDVRQCAWCHFFDKCMTIVNTRIQWRLFKEAA